MGAVYAIEADYPYGSPADSWADLAHAILESGESPTTFEDFEAMGRAWAARAVLLAGGERRRSDSGRHEDTLPWR